MHQHYECRRIRRHQLTDSTIVVTTQPILLG